ncbi:hypothetical protein DPM19_07730 [Actinomadura craniellae]|uniref:Cytochrome P450 n=1 Tax=Actinomadura craniellae TaxID=2231787 RepID=A0A365H9I7_9ACTN|nr:cytochrome P450 [Actinomadura craniellae]RAY15668.1 hypothetical protein DPM19_07730 [Actinomadura craniellae]
MPQRRGAIPVSDIAVISSPDTYIRGMPHDQLARLRARTPVVWIPDGAEDGAGLWAVLRYTDVRHVFEHPQIFVRAPDAPHPLGTWMRRATAPRRRPASSAPPGPGRQPAGEPARRAAKLLDLLSGRGTADLVGEVMAGLPGPVRDAVSGGVYALLRHPDQYARLRRDRDLLAGALEEMLRWWSPVIQVRRTVRRTTSLGGVPMRPGEQVAAWIAAANHDDEVFEDPGRFDIGRPPGRHLLHGEAARHCSAVEPARTQLRAVIGAILDRPGRIEVAGRPLRLRSITRNGFSCLPLRPAQDG